MLPLRDEIPTRTTPVVNYALIWICSIVFFNQFTENAKDVSILDRFAMVPARIADPEAKIVIEEVVFMETEEGWQQVRRKRPLEKPAVPPIATLLTCCFLHAGWLHYIGNMWFLYVFGDNVEDRLGHVGYLALYLFSGLVASGAHLLTNWGSEIPTLGASGAIAGVMGAYLVLYPHVRVLTIIPIFIIPFFVRLRAWVLLVIWFVMQFFNGLLSINAAEATGVAWWAHVGGFVAGAGCLWVLGRSTEPIEPTYADADPPRRTNEEEFPW